MSNAYLSQFVVSQVKYFKLFQISETFGQTRQRVLVCGNNSKVSKTAQLGGKCDELILVEVQLGEVDQLLDS